MKLYEAVRTSDGDVMAFVDGEPLYHVVAHTPDGFALGRGSGAADLALSILADYFGERPSLTDIYEGNSLSMLYHHDFKWAVIAPAAAAGAVRISSTEIAGWLAEQGQAPAA